jgi:Pyruvate/2-oxoacid:ferredoxin oxidoreductase delta subunit
MTLLENLTFYYFSGTGNSKKVAAWFCDEISRNGITTNLIDLSKDRETPRAPQTQEIIGFISPTHGFNYPPLMIHYLFRFPRPKYRNKVLLMNTRAGMKLSKLFLPGFSGISMWLAALVLLIKGYRIIGMRSIDLPSNWISLHPGLRSKVVTSMFEHYETITRQLAHKIMQGKKIFRLSLWLGMPLDLASAPIAAAYYCVGRFIIAKTFVATKACDNCNLCMNQCPVKAISLVDKRPYWSVRCESCMRCMNNCPKRAIETAHGLLAFIIVVLYSGILAFVYRTFPVQQWPMFGFNPVADKFTKFVMESVFIFFLLVTVYRGVHYLKRYRWFDNLVAFTSLTKYKFWRRYKGKVGTRSVTPLNQ